MRESEKGVSIRDRLAKGQNSPFKTYRELTVGEVSLARFIFYEIFTCLFGPIPGAAGLKKRKKFYPWLFKKTGKGLIIGRNVTIRHPDKIKLGNNVTIDDNCLIDGRGSGDAGIVFEDNVIINRNCMIQAKAGPIRIGKRTSIGSNSAIVSMDGVEFEEAVLVAGGCYISAGSYHFKDLDSAIMDQGVYSKDRIYVGAKSWLGTGVIVLDGVNVGAGAIIGAGAVVVKSVPENAIAAGIPAKVQKIRACSSSN